MKIRFLVSMGGVGQNYDALEKDNKGDFVYYDFSDSEAIALINDGIAEPKTKKDYDSAIEKIEALKVEEEKSKKLSELNADLESLQEEKEQLTNRLLEIEKSILEVEEIIKGK